MTCPTTAQRFSPQTALQLYLQDLAHFEYASLGLRDFYYQRRPVCGPGGFDGSPMDKVVAVDALAVFLFV